MNSVLSHLLLAATLATQMPTLASEVIVKVANIEPDRKGNISVMLFAKEGFPNEHSLALATQTLPASTEKLTVTFDAVPEQFAIKAHHDEDESGSVSKNWTGIFPSEGLGFSNGAKLRFGPPSFQKAMLEKFNIDGAVEIAVIYP